MKRLLAILAALALLLGLTTPAHADTYEMRGRVLATYQAAGGEAALGSPVEPEQKARMSGRNFYWQHIQTSDGTRSIVFWSSLQGGKGATQPDIFGLSGASRERDAAARSTRYGDEGEDLTLRGLWLFRSGNLCRTTSRDRQLMAAMLAGGVLIDLRTSGAAKDCPDPTLTNVTKKRYGIDSSAANKYGRYATDAAIRKSLGSAVAATAATLAAGRPVWIHCTKGKDRTGIAVTVILALAGADQASIVREYLRGGDVTEDDLMTYLDAIATRYPETEGEAFPGIYRYAIDGLGLTDAEIAQIQQALAV